MKAFPKTREYNISDGSEGMDLRDYFAAKAMQAILQWNVIENVNVSKEAYMMADLMIKAREL